MTASNSAIVNSTETSSRAASVGTFGRNRVLVVTLLLLLGALPYLDSLANGFVYDDASQVLGNPYIQSYRFIPQIFTTQVWSFQGQQGPSNYVRPLLSLGYLVCYKFFGPLAYGFHLANVVLNVLVVLVIFGITARMFQERRVAFLAAGIFALHPIHTEVVAWVAAVSDIELTLFLVLTLWFYFRVAAPQGGRSERAQLGMVIAFVFALLAKEQAMMFPLIAMTFEHFYRDDRRETTALQKIARYDVLWLLDLAYVLYRFRVLGGFAPVEQRANMTWHDTLLTAMALLSHYFVKLLWPVHLDAFYVVHNASSFLDPRVVKGVAELAVCAVIFAVLWKYARLASFGMVWFFATLAPVLDARIMTGNDFAERYLYLPSVGFCWIVAWVGIRLWDRVSPRKPAARWALGGAAGILAALAFVKIVTRNRVWRSDLVLYQTTLAASPPSAPMLDNLGVTYWNMRDVARARLMWLRGLQLNPHSPILHNNLGLYYQGEKDYARAAEYFEQAIRLKPGYGDAHMNLGVDYEKMNMDQKAELQFRAAAMLSPDLPGAHNKLGRLYLREGRLEDARREFDQSVRTYATYEGYDGLGDVNVRTRRPDRAEAAYRHALEVNAFDDHAHFGLAALLAARGDRTGAVREYQKGFETNPKDPEALAAFHKLTAPAHDGKP